MFDAVANINKSVGKVNVKHMKPISPEDLKKIHNYFSQYMLPDPLILQRMVHFNLMFYPCRHLQTPQENLTHMSKDTFNVSLTEFLILCNDLVNK